MRKLLMLAVAAVALFAGRLAVANDSSDLLKQVQELRAQLDKQQTEINALKGQQYVTRDEATRLVQDELATSVDQKIEAGFAQMKDSSPMLKLGKGIEQLEIVGDLRLRYETAKATVKNTGVKGAAPNDLAYDSFQYRLRLGMVWKAEGWEVGVGLVTSDTGAGQDSNSTYSNVYVNGGGFAKSVVAFDYAYAKHTWGDFSLTLGQQKNSFLSTAILWDEDIRPIGVTGQYKYEGAFVTAGFYNVANYDVNAGWGFGGNTSDANAYLSAAQVGYAGSYDQLDFKGALAWYYFNDATTQSNDNNAGGTLPGTNNNPKYAYNIGDFYGEAGYKVEDWKGIVYGEILKNFDAKNTTGNSDQTASSQLGVVNGHTVKAKDNDMAWTLGGKLQAYGAELGYAYARIEADAVPLFTTDNQFGQFGQGGPTDVKGHIISLKYDVSKNLTLGATAYLTKPIELKGTTGDVKSSKDYFFDVTYKF